MRATTTRIVQGALIGMALVLTAIVQAAPLVNGGFETGDLTGWSCADGQVFDGLPLVGPSEGHYMAMVAARQAEGLPPNGHGGGDCTTGTAPVSLVALKFVEITTSDDTQSEMWQAFSVNSAQTIAFDWNILSNDVPGFDFGWVSIFDAEVERHCEIEDYPDVLNCPPVQNLDGFANIGIPVESQPAPVAGSYFRQSGWHTSAFTLPTAGDYILALGVAQRIDPLYGTAMLIDNVRLIPEPATPLLVLTAIGALMGLSRLGTRPRITQGSAYS